MATVTEKIPYYVVKNGVGYWQPPAWAREKPYQMEGCKCGPDGPEARDIARDRVKLMCRLKVHGVTSTVAPAWPKGSLGHFYEVWTRTPSFGKKALGTRNEFEQAWAHVPDKLKKKLIDGIVPIDIERLQLSLEETKTDWTRWRTIKKLREILKAAVHHGFIKQSPALTMANSQPLPRNQLFTAAEVKKLIDTADELGRSDMSLLIDLLWVTMMSPVDVRSLTKVMIRTDKEGLYIERGRTKTRTEIMVDLPDDTARRLKAFMNGLPEMLPAAIIVRKPNGKAFRDRHELAEAFREIRDAALGIEDKRQMRDIRRSANVEADLGGASPEDRAAVLANSLHKNARLEATYTPPTLAKARQLREKRKIGEAIMKAALGEQETGS